MTSEWTLQPPEGCVVLVAQSGAGFIPWDNPDNVVSQQLEKMVDCAVAVVCLPLLFLISAPCNVINMLVFYKQGLQERVHLCLFCLSLVDLLHMLNSVLYNADRMVRPFQLEAQAGPVLRFIVDHHLTGLRGFTWLSGFISMLIACDRCLCVVAPLRSHTVIKTRTTAALLVLGTVFILTGSLLGGLRWSLACIFHPEANSTSTALYTSQFYAQHRAHMDLLSLFAGTIQPLTYVTIVMATTIVTSVKLKKMVAWREETSSSTLSWREVALTRTLIAVSIVYMICSIPIMMIGLGVMFVPDLSLSGRYYNLGNLFVSLFELGSYINATFNFFVYCFLGSKYKETLGALFHCRKAEPVSTVKPGRK